MDQQDTRFHYGHECRHFTRSNIPLADGRCALTIERYSAPAYDFLDDKMWIPIIKAAEYIGISVPELVKRAKAEEFKHRPRPNAEKRIRIYSNTKGEQLVTSSEYAKLTGMDEDDVKAKVEAGELATYDPLLGEIESESTETHFEAEHLDEHMEIAITMRWESEKCPLFDTKGVRVGGICYHFDRKEEGTL